MKLWIIFCGITPCCRHRTGRPLITGPFLRCGQSSTRRRSDYAICRAVVVQNKKNKGVKNSWIDSHIAKCTLGRWLTLSWLWQQITKSWHSRFDNSMQSFYITNGIADVNAECKKKINVCYRTICIFPKNRMIWPLPINIQTEAGACNHESETRWEYREGARTRFEKPP